MSSVSQIRIRSRLAKLPDYVFAKFPRYEKEFFHAYANFFFKLNLFKNTLTQMSNAQRKLIGEIATAAISTLIHEVLHVKLQQRRVARYVEEGMVQRLEKTYMKQWAEKLDEVLRSQFAIRPDMAVGFSGA